MEAIATNITEVIEALVTQYTSGINFRPDTAMDINCGMCEYFAESVIDKIEGAKAYWGDELTTDFWDMEIENWVEDHAYGHCFIFFEDKFYDAEAPNGVDHPKELPFYIRRLEYAIKYKDETYDGFWARMKKEGRD